MVKASPPPDLNDLSADDLRGLVIGLLETVAALEAKVAALTEENARLKNLKGRPKLKPSGMEKGTGGALPSPGDKASGKRRRRGGKTPPKSVRLIVDEDVVLPLAAEPGWRFKGYRLYTVQDLVVAVRVVRYWRPCYRTPDGRLMAAPLPPEVKGHFGPNLVRYLLSQHYQCRVTMPLLEQQLRDFGVLISSGQNSSLLTRGHDPFHAEKAALRQAGLETARWLTVDDTGARHLGENGVTTRSEEGRRCRDTFLSLKKTCQKNAIPFWAYLGDRLGILPGTIDRLANIIRQRASPAPA